MQQYRNYLGEINKGFIVPPARENMPSTRVKPSLKMDFNFYDGFPIITGKQMPFYSILGELICFMQGCTDVRDFQKLGCKVWWDNAYNWNVKQNGFADKVSKEDYIAFCMETYNGRFHSKSIYINDVLVGYNLGKIYSYFWRDLEYTDQLLNIVNSIINYPSSRYHVLDAWDIKYMNSIHTSQPNCHVYYQATCFPVKDNVVGNIEPLLYHIFDDETAKRMLQRIATNVNPQFIHGHLTQRSCDAFLGVPFNITSYSLLTILLAVITKNIPYGFSWVGVNNHIYSDHQEAVDSYLFTTDYDLPRLHIDINSIESLEDIENISSLDELKSLFHLVDYQHGPKIPAPLSVGM